MQQRLVFFVVPRGIKAFRDGGQLRKTLSRIVAEVARDVPRLPAKRTSADYLSGTQFEKDTENIEQYSNDQQTFYILSNVDTITATWSDGLIVEQITGNISDEYMKKIIDSIGGV